MHRLRRALLNRGYTCDNCGSELFDYPLHRLCAACEEKLKRSNPACPKCGRWIRSTGVCMDCKALPPAFTRGVSPFVYKGESGVLINRLKNGNPRIAAYLGEQMAEEFSEKCFVEKETELLLVAVPLTKKKKALRGYNQAERLAESVCDRLTAKGYLAKTAFSLLQKRKETKPQKRMTRKERAENVKGAYRVTKRKDCRGRVILLIDDVCTTGATASECASRLFGAGASAVYFLSAAAVPEQK